MYVSTYQDIKKYTTLKMLNVINSFLPQAKGRDLYPHLATSSICLLMVVVTLKYIPNKNKENLCIIKSIPFYGKFNINFRILYVHNRYTSISYSIN